MSYRAWAYLWSVIGGAVGFALLSHLNTPPTEPDYLVFGVWLVLAIGAQLVEVKYGRQSYYPHFVTFFAAMILLPPAFLTLLVVIPHLAEWLKKRMDDDPTLNIWYIQPFNIATHLIAALAGQHAFILVGGSTSHFTLQSTLVAPVLAMVVYVVVNHLLVGEILVLARKLSWSESGVMDLGNISAEMAMMGIGYISALLWTLGPWTILFAFSPLGLIHRALRVPQLEKEARTDEKTGLANNRYFNTYFAEELERARRSNQPLAVIMADLDLLRDINNVFGHLAGDVVISEIGQIIHMSIRGGDVAARFGGEEYALVLANTDLDSACVVAERLRETVEATDFHAPTHPEPIHATMSLGVACYPQDGATVDELVNAADVALYQAKNRGRNQVVNSEEVPAEVKRTFSENQSKSAEQDVPADAEHLKGPAVSAATSSEHHPDVELSPAAERAAMEDPFVIEPEERSAVAAPRQRSRERIWPFVWGIIGTGVAVGVVGTYFDPHLDLPTLGLFALLALLSQWFQVQMYDKSSVSISMAVVFATAVVAGPAGAAVVSTVVGLVHFVQVRPKLYKLFFNSSVHMIAGLGPILAVHVPMQDLGLPMTSRTILWWVAPVLLASGFYYLCETGLIAIAIGLSERSPIRAGWRAQFGWLARGYVVMGILGFALAVAYIATGILGIVVFSLPIFIMHVTQKEYIRYTEKSVRKLQEMNRDLSSANEEVNRGKRAIEQLNDELFITLARVIDIRDPFVSGHVTQAGEYAQEIARELGLPPGRVERIYRAGLLHDVGKLGIPEHILHKPGKLTDEEYCRVKQHVRLGAELLEASRGLRDLAPFVRHHHERWDGGGYPAGLKGEEIPLEARILAVCDSVDAMASDRPYRQGMPLPAILQELRKCSGKQFDPRIVEAFVRVLEKQGKEMVVNSALKVTEVHGNGCLHRPEADTSRVLGEPVTV